MNLGRTFTTTETPEMARRRIGEYLERAGYKPVGPAPAFTYTRGSRMGSLTGFSPRKWGVSANLQVAPDVDGLIHVTVGYAIDTTGQTVIKREREFWDKELDGLVAAAGGTNAAVTPLAQAEENVRTQARAKGGANWFYWIAGMSLLNSLMWIFNLGYTFFIGLGITQLVDGIATGLGEYVAPDYATLLRIAALFIDVLFAGLFILFGYLANRGRHWAFIVGAVLYGLDALIFLMVPDFVSIGFHVFGLVIILNGMRAAKKAAQQTQVA